MNDFYRKNFLPRQRGSLLIGLVVVVLFLSILIIISAISLYYVKKFEMSNAAIAGALVGAKKLSQGVVDENITKQYVHINYAPATNDNTVVQIGCCSETTRIFDNSCSDAVMVSVQENWRGNQLKFRAIAHIKQIGQNIPARITLVYRD
jgi:hypothetical protein